MESKEVMLKRRSVREYTSKKVSDEQIKSMLEAAMAAPTAMNSQPWEFYVVSDENKVQELKDVHEYYDYNSSLIIVVCANKDNFIKAYPDFFIQDCSSAITNMLNEATNLGLGTVWCGVYPLEDRMQDIAKVLELKDHILPFALIHVGYPSKEPVSRTQYNESKIHRI